jgi:hypothetical protein
MATLFSVCLGLGVAAACGFRIFLPFLVMNLAARAGYLTLGSDFEWISGTPALITFAVATAAEIGAYYIPGVDNLLDAIATPAAIVAGVVASASVVTGMDPYLKWTLATIAGGSIAGAVQMTTVGLRQLSLFGTGGVANPAVSSAEAAGSLVMTIVSVALPVLAVVLVFLGLITARRLRRARRARRQREPAL